MTYAKQRWALGIGVAIVLAGSPTALVLSTAQAGVELPPSEILKRAQEKYASLTSYRDNGRTVNEINGMRLTTTYRIKLARPSFYLVEWEQPLWPGYTNKGAVWSSGEGDLLRTSTPPMKQPSRELALGGATGISGSATATIPGTFFRMHWGNQLWGPPWDSKRQRDEKVGDVDCYVFTSGPNGRTKTLYIGKQDFLIHQVRTVTSQEALKAGLAELGKGHPENTASVPKSGAQGIISQGIISTETHENIVVNQEFSDKDFIPRAQEK